MQYKSNLFSVNAVVGISLMQTEYTTSEAMGSVSVCVDIDSAQLARNVSVTIRNVAAGQAVGKLFKCWKLIQIYLCMGRS